MIEGLIKIAEEAANKTDHKQRVGAVIFKGKRIISVGRNYKSRSLRRVTPGMQRYPTSVHAEMDAIIKAKTDLKGYNILVVRINSFGQMRLAKPCDHCYTYIKHVGLRHIYYSTNDGIVEYI